MNKQEAIEKIENIGTLNIYDKVTGQQVDMVIKNEVLDIISQILEPQKVVVPKFLAEWIKSHKESFSDVSAIDMYDNLTSDNRSGYYHEVWLWVIAHHYDFIKAWHDGYKVEQEKLYTVEIAEAILTKITRGRNVKYKMLPSKDVSDVFDKGIYATGLTETEIKQKDERLWQFAKEVEE